MLAHAVRDTTRKKFDDFLIVDIDAHVSESAFWDEMTDFIPSDVWKYNAKSFKERGNATACRMRTRASVPERVRPRARTPASPRNRCRQGVHKQAALSRRAIESMGIDYMCCSRPPMLGLGMHPQPEVEVQLARAYNRWLTRAHPAAGRRASRRCSTCRSTTPRRATQMVENSATRRAWSASWSPPCATSRCTTTPTCGSTRCWRSAACRSPSMPGSYWDDGVDGAAQPLPRRCTRCRSCFATWST